MDVGNMPIRGVREFHKNGINNVYQEGKRIIIEDIINHTIYNQFIKRNINVLSRKEMKNLYKTKKYNMYGEDIKTKGKVGFRGLPDPYRYNPGNRCVSVLFDAHILGPVGPALTESGTVVADSIGDPRIAPRRIGVTLARSMRLNGIRRTWRALPGNVSPDQQIEIATLAVPPWNNYYHWTIECLLRVRLLEKYGAETGTYPTLLIPAERSSWMNESLELLDYTGEIETISRGIVNVDTLVVPTFPDTIPVECSWIRNRMLEAVDSGQDNGKRIYISREDATVRRVSNSREIEAVLKQHGVDTYVLSDLTVKDQIQLFNSADLVVSPHGAGLTNIVYGEDLTVVELFGDKKMATFDRIAENMEHDYRYLECEQDGIDIHVDPDSLDQLLKDIDETT